QILVRSAVEIGNDEALLAFRILTEGHRAGHFREYARIFRRTCFEKLGHARQTTRDVAGLRSFLRDTREHFADAHFLTIAHRDDRTDLEGDVDRDIGAREAHFLTIFVEEFYLRTESLRLHAAAAFRIDDDESRQPGHFVDLTCDGD